MRPARAMTTVRHRKATWMSPGDISFGPVISAASGWMHSSLRCRPSFFSLLSAPLRTKWSIKSQATAVQEAMMVRASDVLWKEGGGYYSETEDQLMQSPILPNPKRFCDQRVM